MKLLVIGIDGGTKRILDHMPMPFTHKLFSMSNSRVLNEDLLSRGWVEVITGKHASETKAFYLMPFNDKTYKFSTSYNQKDLLGNSDVVPIWKRVNELGASVGILNIPTTGPVQELNGFIVAGGGGGLKATGKQPASSMIFPEKYAHVLDENNYIFDIRLPSGSHTFSEFADTIKLGQETQKNTFIDLCARERPDFGFHCFRMTTELQYLAFSELDLYMNTKTQTGTNMDSKSEHSSIQSKLVQHYAHMDSCIKEIFSELQPEHFMFVGDHSTAPFKYDVNMDAWLEANGYLKQLNGPHATFMGLLAEAGRINNRVMASAGVVRRWPSHRSPVTRFSKSKTLAFGLFYDPGNFGGIYINDSSRFGGPVKSTIDAENLARKICLEFNRSSDAISHNLHALPYRSRHCRAKYSYLMPDIEIQKPDSYYFSSRRRGFIEENPNYGHVPEDLTGIRYPFTGVKGRDPIFVYDKFLEPYIKDSDPSDLRTVYEVISRLFRSR